MGSWRRIRQALYVREVEDDAVLEMHESPFGSWDFSANDDNESILGEGHVGGTSHFTNWICRMYNKLTFWGGEGGPQ